MVVYVVLYPSSLKIGTGVKKKMKGALGSIPCDYAFVSTKE